MNILREAQAKRVSTDKDCESCKGTGYELPETYDGHLRTCFECNGSGKEWEWEEWE